VTRPEGEPISIEVPEPAHPLSGLVGSVHVVAFGAAQPTTDKTFERLSC
jgi:hypothetical protein